MSTITGVVRGPVSGGTHGWAFGGFSGDLAELGYIEEEYFLSGSAHGYVAAGEFGLDGKWPVTRGESAPFTTRFVVRRPSDPSRFSGTVIAEWINVTSGFDLISLDLPTLYEGHVHVAISAQQVGVTGFEVDPAGLITWDPERYGELSHPGDGFSYDIFTQAARVVGSDRDSTGVDPLRGLVVSSVVAAGVSQSGLRLLTYANAVQPIEHAVDGILASVSIGAGHSLKNLVVDPSRMMGNPTPEELEMIFGIRGQFRDDLDVPVFLVNSECEAFLYAPSRQPDSDRFRFWEVAGASHAPAQMMTRIGQTVTRDFGAPVSAAEALSDASIARSTIEWRPALDAAFGHMLTWIAEGTAPPVQPRLDLDGNGQVMRDGDGNAIGGVRLPDIDVPIARFEGGGIGPGTIGLGGLTDPFSAEKLHERYSDHDEYVRLVIEATERALATGLIRPWAADEYISTARSTRVPSQ